MMLRVICAVHRFAGGFYLGATPATRGPQSRSLQTGYYAEDAAGVLDPFRSRTYPVRYCLETRMNHRLRRTRALWRIIPIDRRQTICSAGRGRPELCMSTRCITHETPRNQRDASGGDVRRHGWRRWQPVETDEADSAGAQQTTRGRLRPKHQQRVGLGVGLRYPGHRAAVVGSSTGSSWAAAQRHAHRGVSPA